MIINILLSLPSYLFDVVVLTTIGVILANIVIETNIMSRIALYIAPLCRASNLPQECIISVIECIFSPAAGRSTLSEFYRKGMVTETETTAAMVMSTFTVVLGESFFRIQALIAITILGPLLGTLYVFFNLFSSFLQAVWASAYARLVLPPRNIGKEGKENKKPLVFNRSVVSAGFKKSFKTLGRLIPIMVVTVVLVGVLTDLGILNYISGMFNPILYILGLPGESITALMAQFAHFSAGYIVVSTLYTGGTLSLKQALITLMLGSMIVITMIYMRYSFSTYVSLFGKLGVKLTAINYLSSMAAKIITISVVWLIF